MINDAREVLDRLSGGGWSPLFKLLNIDPGSDTLEDDLLRPVELTPTELAQIPGFGDIAQNARRAIEPGNPARSILFHALSSPGVVTAPDGTPLKTFPTVSDLDLIENLVFGLVPPTLQALVSRLGSASNLAIVVFAREYRQSSKTVHGEHADMIYARTGIIRVGTREAVWDGRLRAFVPRRDADDPFDFRVMPCRYASYIAIQLKGKKSDFGPFEFNRGYELRRQAVDKPDGELDFWVPVHKLFDGPRCLLGKTLSVELEAHHVNEKLKRIHENNMGFRGMSGFDSGFKPPDTEQAPFLITSGLAEFLDGIGTLAPVVRPRMIEPTTLTGHQIGAKVAARRHAGLSPSYLTPGGRDFAHPSPEWMHVRRRLKSNGDVEDLNEKQNVAQTVRDARVGNDRNYVAGHFTDFTGDGWINTRVSGLQGDLNRMVPAYSLIAAPDFYPYVDQSVLLNWWRWDVPERFRNEIWRSLPLTLADQRSAANITLRDFGADIRPENKTPTAMVGLKDAGLTQKSIGSETEVPRVSSLPDAGAGIYQPGWDVSTDLSSDPGAPEDVLHLAAYGLGSPFPEDAKLCAALSAYWPGVAPDTARATGFQPVAPMTDREMGLQDAPAWDGILGPRRATVGTRDFFETDNFAHVDYVTSALDGRFTMVETMKLSQQDYQFRIIATARMYRVLGEIHTLQGGLTSVHDGYRMLSFGHGHAGDLIIADAENALGTEFEERACSFIMVHVGSVEPLKRDDVKRTRWIRRENILKEYQFVVDDLAQIAVKSKDDGWKIHEPQIA